MGPNLESIFNIMVDRPPQEWIGGLMVALFLSLALAGADMAFRRWVKVQEDTTPLVGLAMVVIFSGMVIAAVSSELKLKGPAGPAGGDSNERSSGGPGRGPGLDRDSRASGRSGGFTSRMADLIFGEPTPTMMDAFFPEEAASAAGKFIEEANRDGETPLDRDALIELLREHLRSPGSPPPPPPRTLTRLPGRRPELDTASHVLILVGQRQLVEDGPGSPWRRGGRSGHRR